MMEKIKNIWARVPTKYKSLVAWASLLPTLVALGDSLNIWNVIGLPKTTFMQVVAIVGTLVNAVGSFNNPDSREKF